MESIIKAFSTHGTLIQPDTLDYILSKENPQEFSNIIAKELQDFPLILTIQQIKDIEEKLDGKQTKHLVEPIENITEPVKQIISNEIQEKILRTTPIPSTTVCIQPEKHNKPLVQPPSTWNPSAKDYDSDVRIIKDVTGNSTCEGTTKDFAKLFSDRFDTLRTHLRTQRRELMQVLPINR